MLALNLLLGLHFLFDHLWLLRTLAYPVQGYEYWPDIAIGFRVRESTTVTIKCGYRQITFGQIVSNIMRLSSFYLE